MPQRVLVIDDSPLFQRLISAWLKADALDIQFATNATTGLSTAATFRPDLILLDVEMPDTNGFDLCRQIKSDPALASIPLIFLTGARTPEERVRGLNMGAVDYIIKPFHPAEFQARVRAALRTKQLLDLLQERAQIDGLTSLGNRAFFDERLKVELAVHHRRQTPLSCVMLDVDHFKQVNDRWGHLAGDEVLRVMAELLLDGTRTEDVVARYGGEEFIILTPGVDVTGAIKLAERLRSTVEKTTMHRLNGTVRVTCSFGVAAQSAVGHWSLVNCADAALYAAKRGGRNCVVRFEPSMISTTLHDAA